MTGPTSDFCPAELKRLAICPKALALNIDHTCLGNDDKPEDIEKLVKEAVDSQPNSVAICIYPKMIPHAKESLKKRNNTTLLIATVINFPLGRDPPHKVIQDAKDAIAMGANEVDLVIDYAFIKRNKEYGTKAARNLVKAVKEVCGKAVTLKVIIETGELKTPELILAASMAAMKGGANFIKTSTGKVPVNATPESCGLMLSAIATYQATDYAADVGFKPAGGIKSPEAALEILQLAEATMGAGWVNSRHFRFGASSLLAQMRQALSEKHQATTA